MYVRQISRINKDGSRVRYLQLAHKFRDPETGKSRDQVLCHLGREDQIDREQLRRLIRSISRFLDPDDQSRVQAELEGVSGDVVVDRSLSYGGSYVLNAVWQRLELDRVLAAFLADRAFGGHIERLLFAMVVAGVRIRRNTHDGRQPGTRSAIEARGGAEGWTARGDRWTRRGAGAEPVPGDGLLGGPC